LQEPIPFSLFKVVPAVFSPVARIGHGPLFLAAFLVGFVDRIGSHLMPLPRRLFGPLAFFLLTGSLIFVPCAWIKKITAISTLYLLHNHLLPV